ncbi:flavin-containing monooxygenase [Phytohabitans houttuyneae]|uniref:Flavin-binding monooxygenase n=1 Tax=Phytohabitans houttuyneae TaxID=1076126 RepID=A0A6V8KQR7_9ACTN|nr:NAD(P)-binding domain-containing protein [Phytohabitans houttuyneae]GFJ85740.1 flavin-binding monooxygenase [Phytohabitans houttuyneae]
MTTSTDHDSATLWRDGRPVYDRGDTVCVVGAGPSGLVAIKNLREHGFGVDCYERETGVGGGWNWRHDRSPVYGSAHLISSKPFTQYPDFPMPDDWPDYPHHSHVLSYLERYADHFDLRPHIWFGTEVVKVEPADGMRWDVTTRSTGGYGAERTHRYLGVVVANGHNWSPNLPAYQGLDDFKGRVIHSSAYKDPAELRGKRVLVIGGGNTGCDIAVEAAQQASRCWHSTRRGYWYAPKYVLGRPADQFHDAILRLRLPLWLRQWLLQRTLRLTVGDLRRFGMRRPDHKVFETHPIVNSQLIYHVGHGGIAPVPDIARFRQYSVELTDGTEVEPDIVVAATGYRPRFEFLAPETLAATPEGRPRLHLHAFSRRHPTLAVAGLLESDSGLLPLVHWQTVAIARWLRLREAAPQRAGEFWASTVAKAPERRLTGAKVQETPRHWFEVGHVDYLRALQKMIDGLAGARA